MGYVVSSDGSAILSVLYGAADFIRGGILRKVFAVVFVSSE